MNEGLRKRLEDLPENPGCYIMRDRRGRIIYVGKAKSLRRRVRSYFRPATIRHADPRINSLINSIHDLEWIVTRTEDQALLTENELIKQHQPRYNVLLRDDKRYLAIRCDLREPLPRFSTCRLIRDDGAEYFGPFPSGGRFVRPVLDHLERAYGLRRCSPLVPDAETYRHCNDDIIRTCSAPCIFRITPEEYRERVLEVCAILRGERPSFIAGLKEQMGQAARDLNFEYAARLRDIRTGLIAMARQRSRGPVANLKQQRDEALKGLQELQAALRLPRPPRMIECFDISNISGKLAYASLVVAVDGVPDRRRYRLFRIKEVDESDDPRMIGEAVKRRYSRVLREELLIPDLMVVDGGITQLRAARSVLENLEIDNLPSVGLAERYEELVVDDGRPPLRLPRDSAGLKLVMHLRDEAHRFAVNHHRRLRSRLIRESALDEIPGIGSQRKMLLLKTFGSVRRLEKATISEIAAVPGIGPVLAAAIQQVFRHKESREK